MEPQDISKQKTDPAAEELLASARGGRVRRPVPGTRTLAFWRRVCPELQLFDSSVSVAIVAGAVTEGALHWSGKLTNLLANCIAIQVAIQRGGLIYCILGAVLPGLLVQFAWTWAAIKRRCLEV